MQVRKLRVLRLKYHISLVELSCACGISPQRLSEIELNPGRIADATVAKLLNGLTDVIHRRQCTQIALQADFERTKSTLMEPVGETDHVI